MKLENLFRREVSFSLNLTQTHRELKHLFDFAQTVQLQIKVGVSRKAKR